MMENLPNILTLGRLVLLIPMIVLFFLPFEWAAWTCLALYVIGAASDWLDGWIARKYNQTSEFGALIDPISDKIFVITIMLMLVAIDRIEGVLVLSVVIIIIREFTVSGLREYLSGKDVKMPVSNLAKWKTTLQMIALGIFIVSPYIWGGFILGALTLLGATALTVITGWDYLKTGLDHIKKTKKTP